MAAGFEQKQKLREAGFTAQQIAEWEANQTARLQEGGFSQTQIDEYFGRGAPNTAAIRDIALKDFIPASEEEQPVMEARGFLQGLSAGFQGSISGITARQQLPDIVLSEDANFVETFGAALGQFAGDLPISLPAFIAGAKIGAPVGAAAGTAATRTPVGAAAGTLAGGGIGGGAVSGFVTGSTREALIQFYRDNEGQEVDARKFSSRLIAAVMNPEVLERGGKEAGIGAITGVVRVPVTGAVRPVAGKVVNEIAVQGTEVVVGVTAAAALEGQLPNPQDFAAAGALVLGFQAGGALVRKREPRVRDAVRRLEEHYVRTGERPEQAVERARRDRVFRQMIVSGEGEPSTVDKTVKVPGPKIEAGSEERIIIRRDNTPQEGIEAAQQADTPHSAIVAAAAPSTVLTKRGRPLSESEIAADRAVANARASIRERIRPLDRKGWSIKKTIDDLRFRYVNRLQFMVSAAETAYRDATGKRLSVENNPGELARLAFGALAKADMAIKRGVFDAEGNKIAPAFEEILKPIEKGIDAFVEFAVAKRVVEKENQGLKTGFDIVDADLLVKTGSKEFQKAFDDLQAWANTQLDDAVSAGLLSKEGKQTIIEQNRDYVPFARVLDDVAQAPPGTTARGLPVRKATKRFTGSEKEILDPLEVMAKNRYAIQQIIENNRARQRFVELNDQLPEEFQFLKKAPKKLTVTKIAEGDTQLKKFLEENGLSIEDVTGIHLYRAMAKNLSHGEFIVFQDGQPVVFKAADPDLVKSLNALERNTMSMVTKVAAQVSAVLRSGVTINPEFVIKATGRDQLAAVLQNDFLVVPFVDTIRGISGLIKKDKDFIKWVNAGGANSSLLSLDRQLLSVMLKPKQLQIRDDLIRRAWNVGTSPARLAANISLIAENSLRLGRFKRALKEGKPLDVAALQSRDVALDFARRGADLEAYNAITAWQGAAINGIDRFHTAFTRTPGRTMLKTLALITVPSLALWALHKDEQWFQELEDWERAMFWHIPTGFKDEAGDPIIARIPMPHQFGPVFGFLPQKILEDFGRDNEGVLEGLAEVFRQTYSVPVIPVAVSPIMELAANHSFFTGEPIVGRTQQALLPEYRYTPYTTELSKKMAQTLAQTPLGQNFQSPVAIEHMVRGYSGSIGTELFRGLDFVGRKLGFLRDFDRPDPQLADNPVYGAFFMRNPGSGKSLSDFYDNAEKMEQIRNTIRQELRRSSPGEVERILRRRGAPAIDPTKAKIAIGKLRMAAYGIHFSDTIPGDEKRQLINEIMKQQMAIARAYNEAFEQFQEIEKERKRAR